MEALRDRILDVLGRGPMLLEELLTTLGTAEEAIREELTALMREGKVRRRRSNGFWIYWLDGDGHLDLRDWEMVEGLTVLQVLGEAERLS